MSLNECGELLCYCVWFRVWNMLRFTTGCLDRSIERDLLFSASTAGVARSCMLRTNDAAARAESRAHTLFDNRPPSTSRRAPGPLQSSFENIIRSGLSAFIAGARESNEIYSMFRSSRPRTTCPQCSSRTSSCTTSRNPPAGMRSSISSQQAREGRHHAAPPARMERELPAHRAAYAWPSRPGSTQLGGQAGQAQHRVVSGFRYTSFH